MPDVEHSDETGTIFDLSVLYEDGIYKMYGSWRQNGSVSYTTSRDGFTWDQTLRFSLGGEPGHPWEMVINRPFVLKRATGEYIMWYVYLPMRNAIFMNYRYTGQCSEHPLGGQLGIAKSQDGNEFTRLVGRKSI